jgi:PhzF family phenazine biosynthesis protein
VTLFAPYTEGNATKIEVRSFAPSDGINEDPVCGSGNGAVAAFRYGNAHLAAGAEYTAQQGQCVGRAGQVQVRIDQHGAVWIGGQCVTTADGLLHV